MIESGNRDKQRMFLALWPDDPVRRAVAEAVAEQPRLRGRPVARANWHITLSFLGEIDAPALEAATAAAARVEGEAFELALDHFGHFPRTGVVFLGASEAPQAAADLVAALDTSLAESGFAARRRPWKPHLTLWRKVRRRPRLTGPAEPVRWRVDEFVLVRSELTPGGPAYNVLQRFALAAT